MNQPFFGLWHPPALGDPEYHLGPYRSKIVRVWPHYLELKSFEDISTFILTKHSGKVEKMLKHWGFGKLHNLLLIYQPWNWTVPGGNRPRRGSRRIVGPIDVFGRVGRDVGLLARKLWRRRGCSWRRSRLGRRDLAWKRVSRLIRVSHD